MLSHFQLLVVFFNFWLIFMLLHAFRVITCYFVLLDAFTWFGLLFNVSYAVFSTFDVFFQLLVEYISRFNV